MKKSQIDVLIIGAGISGIGAAYHLQKHCSDKSYLIVEGRKEVGGTWDLFRYPGIRSDSDMYTFGFNFKPWVEPEAIAPGSKIRAYVKEAVQENDIGKRIRFGCRVVSADWSSEHGTWTAQVKDMETGELSEVVSKFLFSCGGYYNYDAGYTPDFQGVDDFEGTIIHPQQWPEDFDYSGKRIVVIGSGATAVTLVPAMTVQASHVIMLQRSPSYVVSRPECQGFSNKLNRFLPAKFAYALNRWKNILLGMYFYSISKRKPDAIKKFIINGVREAVGDDCDVGKHFTPDYNPWDQRVCSVTDGDLFEVIKDGSASIVTDHIDRFTGTGILLQSGEEIEADIIVTATGLKLEMFSGMTLSKDDEVLDPSQSFVYKGMMLSEFPNFAYSVGYTNASWTLKSDLVGEYVCRLVKHMDKYGYDYCIPVVPVQGLQAEPIIDFQSGYVLRAAEEMAKQGSEKPWRLYQNYILDRFSLGYQSVVDDSIDFRQI